jgi:hypothetical protein
MVTNDMALVFTKQSLARALRVSIRSLERLRAKGLLPPTVPGLARPRWSAEVVLEWLRAVRAGQRK